MKKAPNSLVSKRNDAAFTALVQTLSETHTWTQEQSARALNTHLAIRNWLFGWYIVEFEQKGAGYKELYGKQLIERLAQALSNQGLKGVSPTSLRKCREFYQAYTHLQQAVPVNSPKKIQQAVPVESLVKNLSSTITLGWTHYVALLAIKDLNERNFYEIEAVQNNWGTRELERQIDSSIYERLALSRDKAVVKRLSQKGQIVEKPADIIKNPYILEFSELSEQARYSEMELESALIDHLEKFLLELGKGYLFEARQKRFSFDNQHFFVDLVFYNRLLRSYVLIDLKIGDLKHQDLGQMQMYVNYFDRFVKQSEENPTVGILLCHNKSDDLVELTLPKDSNVFASQYKLYLPSKKDLRKQLEEAQQRWENENEAKKNKPKKSLRV